MDYKSPFVKKRKFQKITNEKNVTWLGYKKNINKYIISSSIICLPSYREECQNFLLKELCIKPIVQQRPRL